MTSALAFAVIGVGVACYVLARTHRWTSAQWFLVWLWRWHTGQPHHGKPVTDRGWLRPGTKALTPTGHATRWHHLPRWKQTAWRLGIEVAVILAIADYLEDPQLTVRVIICLTCVAALLGAWHLTMTVRARNHRKTWLHPLHLAAAPLVGIPRAHRAESWISAELDSKGAVKSATLALPQGWPADEKDKARLVAITTAKLGIESGEPTWRLAGPSPMLTLEHSEPPPRDVVFRDLASAVAKAPPDELVFGIGKKGATVSASLASDSPHIAISMGSGGGKSNLAAFLLMQELARGAIALVLDAKWISHPWLIGLPNVAYARTVAELHAAMAWLAAELDRRNQVAFRSVDKRGNIRANVGPRLFVVAEELNFATPQLRAYWQEIRGPGDPIRSPALTGLGATAFAGRQVKMHLVLIGQMLTAAATGSQDSSVKQNTGIIAMSRYTPKGWRAMAEEHPMPPRPERPGRIQLVSATGVRETQVPLIDPEHAQQFVMTGDVVPCPAGMPGRQVPETGTPELASVSDLLFETVTPPLPGLVSLAEAARLPVVQTSHAGLKMARFRDRQGFPERRGLRGAEHLYDPAEIVAYDLARRA